MLFSRWQKLMKKLGLSENRETYIALIDAYSEQHRKYHKVSHLHSVLTCLDEVVHLTEKKDELELALWFHDAVYDPFSKSNESDSADWARKFLDENNISQKIQDLVYQLILSTSHSSVPKNRDEQLIVDVDLSILGTTEDIYKQFEEGVRYEYRKVPSYIFARNRRAILKKFLQRERIYSSEALYEALESQARINLRDELCRLQGRRV